MSIRDIVFDIGGVLEITPDLGLDRKWEQQLNLRPGELNDRLDVQPSEVIFVDDNPEVMISAKEIGIHCILFEENHQVMIEIENCIRTNQNNQKQENYE